MKDERATFDIFKTLHPNNTEEFNPTPENLARWEWHVNHRQADIAVPAFEFQGLEELEAIRKERGAKDWEDLPETMRRAYAILASLFPGIMVAACGSRVRGDYVEAWMPDSFRRLRQSAGMAWKTQSDYDFVAFTTGGPISDLPEWADRLKYAPTAEQIFIPMWDFAKLPKEEHANVLHLIDTNQWKELLKVHDRFQLSTNIYCCDMGPIKRWYKYGVKEGLIS